MSSILASVVPTNAPSIASFGAGGQMYIADMFTGFNISSERTNQLFAFAETDNSVPNAEFLTNLTEARKIGSTMDFKALQIGLRVVPRKLHGTGRRDFAFLRSLDHDHCQ